MSVSGKERLRNWRKKQVNIGKKQVAVNLSGESYHKLNRYKEDTGHSFSTIIDTIISSNEIYSGGAKLNDVPKKTSKAQVNTKKRKSGLKRMDQVMDVSLAIFAEKGFHATSVEDIIKEVGIARRTFYLHFRSKYDLVSQIIDNYLHVFTDIAVRFLDSAENVSSREDIIQMAEELASMVSARDEYRLFGKLVLGEIIGLRKPFGDKIEIFYNFIIDKAIDTIDSLKERGVASLDSDSLTISLCLGGGIKEILFQVLVREKKMDLKQGIDSFVNYHAAAFLVK